MLTILRKAKLGLLVLVLFAGINGCGTATNNDQGTSFMALGFFAEGGDEGGVDPDTGQSGDTVPLFADRSGLTPMDPYDGNVVFARIGLQNRMTSQFIRVVRIDCSYTIAGSNLQIPDDSFNATWTLGPAAATGGSSSAGAVTSAADDTSYMGFDIVSTDLFAFLNANQNYLPKLPFRMIATCEAVGVTQAGNTVTTNPVSYYLLFADYAECCTGTGATSGGEQLGTGQGGTVTGGSASSSVAIATALTD